MNYTHLDAHLSHLNVPRVKHKISALLTPWHGSLPFTPLEIIKGWESQLITQIPLPYSLFFTLINPQLIPSQFPPKVIP
jgi:hypothetical protein